MNISYISIVKSHEMKLRINNVPVWFIQCHGFRKDSDRTVTGRLILFLNYQIFFNQTLSKQPKNGRSYDGIDFLQFEMIYKLRNLKQETQYFHDFAVFKQLKHLSDK